jgi:GntR family transcriptional regulator
VVAEAPLDRGSPVPLYYQLQELLRQQIESGVWAPGDPLPSEPALCRRHDLSRGCVRQALAILEADRAIVRRRGQGTFVAPVRLASGVPGLVRAFQRSAGGATGGTGGGATGGTGGGSTGGTGGGSTGGTGGEARSAATGEASVERPEVYVLDRREGVAEESVCRLIGRPAADILRLTTRWASGGLPYAIGVTFLDPEAVPWLAEAALPGREIAIAGPIPVAQPSLGPAEVSVETTECGRYEADQLGVAERSTLMVTVSVHPAVIDGVERPIEVTRLGYVGDRVQLRFRGVPVRDARPATWSFAP